MPTVTRTFTVTTPPKLVVDYLRDFGHAEQWDPGTRTCERIDSGPVTEGSFWHHVSTIAGVTVELTYKLEELTDRKLVFVGENQSSRIIDTITVDAEGTGSAITYVADLEMFGAARLFGPVMALMFQKRAGDTEKQMATVLNQLATSSN